MIIYRMKALLYTAAFLFLFTGCDEKPKNPVAEYGDAMIHSYQRGQQAGEAMNLEAVRSAVKAYHAADGAYPGDLEKVEPLLGGSKLDFSKYDYNPQNGTVELKAE
jgi:hypothetical protein